jgi:peptidoglycan/xylan/chitin deacetylase (PgdA/CDA1 family)
MMRRGIITLFMLALGWAIFGGASTAEADLNVSITFDDGNADQMPAVQMLTDHGMHGTFFIITNRVGRPDSPYMSWSQVQSIYDAGNEIGGHTLNHEHLPTLTPEQQQTEICGGRQSLLQRGYPQVSFAYPFGDHDAVSEGLVEQCGYLSGRRVGGIGDSPEPKADTIPPQDQWLVRTRGSIDVNDHLDEIEEWITDAKALDDKDPGTDMWFTLVIHHLCDPNVTDCADPAGVNNAYITPADFDSLLDFLQARESTGIHVLPMAQVMDPVPPTSQISCNGTTCRPSLYGDPVSVTLSASDTGRSTGASGVQNIRYTTDGSNPTESSPVYTGPINVGSTTTVKFRAEDNARNVESPVHTQRIDVDDAGPRSSILCDGAPCQPIYNHPVQVTLSATDEGAAGVKGIRYTTDGSDPTGSSPVYTGPITVGATTTIRFRAEDNVGNVEPVRSQTIVFGPLGAFSWFSSRPNGTGKLGFLTAIPGTLRAADARGAGKPAVAATRKKKKRRKARIRPTSRFVPEAGQVALVIKPTKAGRRILKRKRKLIVPVRVTFSTLSGSASQVVNVKLRLKRHRRH